jgi:hypothetical protein
VIHAPHRVEDLSTHHIDRKQDRAESNQSKLGKRVLHEFKHKRVKFKATHGNLMNLLDLAKSNTADN